eukprot:gene6521-8962_t
MIVSHYLPLIKSILHGQFISGLIAGTGIFATFLSENSPNANFPLLMSCCNYALLSTFLISNRIGNILNERNSPIESRISNERKSSLKNNIGNSNIIYWYIFAAIIDVEANFMIILAYNYTSISSVMLLDCFTIPTAMILSYLFMGYRYTYKHLIGTGLSLAGLFCIILNDIMTGEQQKSKNAVLGDLLCLTGSSLYAVSNVLQEYLLKHYSIDEFIGYLGFFGSILSFCQSAIIELPRIKRTTFTTEIVLNIGGFVSCLFCMYVATSMFLKSSGDAIVYNLSLLTSDVYAVIFVYLFEGYLVSWLYGIAFILVLIGLIVYHTEKPPSSLGGEQSMDKNDNNTANRDESERGRYSMLNNQSILIEENQPEI